MIQPNRFLSALRKSAGAINCFWNFKSWSSFFNQTNPSWVGFLVKSLLGLKSNESSDQRYEKSVLEFMEFKESDV